MKVSLNVIKQYVLGEFAVPELVSQINRQLGKVEVVTDLAKRYQDAVIVRVVSCDDHPDADRLHVCRIDDGQAVVGVERGDDGLVQVVCGAPNVRAGMLVVWLPPGSTVPASFDDAEPFVLGSRELRGKLSHGMLASPKELGIGDSHDGILEIVSDETPVLAGASFGETYGLNDTILDIENKMFTHRPDCFGVLGVAREIAGIRGQAFSSPEWYHADAPLHGGNGLELAIDNAAPQSVPRLMAVAVSDVKIAPSPLWLQTMLVRLGSRPINNVVDITNYVMLLTGQPLHAYDYDKIAGSKLVSRLAKDGETVSLLNGKTIKLDVQDIVIADAEKPVGLAGVMGGADSEVDDDTSRIILECATFDMYTIRKTSMRHGLFTDAVTRFNKGQAPLQNPAALSLTLSLLQQICDGQVASPILDDNHASTPEALVVSTSFINSRLGLELAAEDMTQLLQNVEIQTSTSNDDIHITVPFWRTDLEQAEDIVEEIGRLYGFDKLPRKLPLRPISPPATNQTFAFKTLLRNTLASMGSSELLTYSFVHQKTFQRAGQDVSQAFQLNNALSPDLQYYRLSVLPSLLEKVQPNIKAGYDEFTLFEIGKGHNLKFHASDADGLPGELEFVDMVYARKTAGYGAAFYQLRHTLDLLASRLGISFSYQPADPAMDYPVTAPFDLARSAMVTNAADGGFIGLFGELKPSVLKNFKLPVYTAAATLDLSGLRTAYSTKPSNYRPLSKYPKVSQDICLRVTATTAYNTLADLVRGCLKEQESDAMHSSLELLDIYQKPDDIGYKQITFRYSVTSNDKTMTDVEVSAMLDTVAARAAEALQATRI